MPEVIAFLLLPALPPLLIGFQVSDALTAVAESAIFLGVVYVATSYGLIATLRWAFGRARAQLGSLGRLLTRALPLLMVFIAFVFLQSDTWQVAAALDWLTVLVVIGFFFGLSLVFLIARLVPEVARLAEGVSNWPDTLSVAEGTPAGPLVPLVRHLDPEHAPLRWHEWVNVGALVIFGQGVQIALVTLAVQIALVVFGLLLVPVELQTAWTGSPVDALATFTIGGRTLTITAGLISVAAILGAFSGLYFTISALSDATYRAEFFSDADRDLRDVFAVRTVYRTALHAGLGRSSTEPADGTTVGSAGEPVDAVAATAEHPAS